ncbi:phage minor head protein [Kaistia sp. UC242_56]|uniref:phage minor head protein n=1 Tax=Kaistia sp. UC242_56 TaxID=3374625 RepID=UPI0037A38352
MARRSDRDLIEGLLATQEDAVRAAFMEAIADIVNTVVLKIVVERLERGDIEGALQALQLDAAAFSKLELRLADAYNSGGMATVGSMPKVRDPQGGRVVFRFGVRNLEAETWLREHSSALITAILDDQRVAIRLALSEGLAEGQNPRATALNVVGRVNRVTGRREGGIIGITSAQERYVANARQELVSGDPAQLRAYLGRERRDKRFDRTILGAIKSGKPLDAEMITRIVGRYSDRLLELRGEFLARTETMMALSKGRDDAIRQQIEAGKIRVEDVTKIWRSAGDNRVRHTHRALNGKKVPMEGVFQSPSGAVLRFPCDPRAPISEISGCRCVVSYDIDYFASVVERFKAEAA